MAEPAAFPATRLVIVRNAQGEKLEPWRLADHDDGGLSAEGAEQARRLAARFTATGELGDSFVVVTSSAQRAVETGAVVAGVPGATVADPTCGFCNPHSGECDGMLVEEWLATLAQDRLADWSPYAPKSPGGESVRTAIERAAKAFIETVLANRGGTVVVVTHDMPIRAALWAFLSLPFHGLYAYPDFTKTGITEWLAEGWLPETGQMNARLLRYNDHAHLLPNAWR